MVEIEMRRMWNKTSRRSSNSEIWWVGGMEERERTVEIEGFCRGGYCRRRRQRGRRLRYDTG